MYDILAVGELNVDVILTGLKQQPVMGEEILAESYTECMGSSTAISACVASSLGCSTAFFGKLGMDAHGSIVMDTLHRYHIDTSFVRREDTWRTGVTVSMNMQKDRALVTYLGDTINAFSSQEVPLDKIEARHIHVGSFYLQKKLQKDLSALFKKAKAKGMTTSLDPGWDESGSWSNALGDVLEYTDYFFPNENEAACIAQTEDPVKAAMRISEMGCTAIIKRGSWGVTACNRSGKLYSLRGFHVPVVDTTGAGDSFDAGFLTAMLNGKSMEECLMYGNAAGAVSVGSQGGATHCPERYQVEQLLKWSNTCEL